MIRQDDGKWPLEFFDYNGYNLNLNWNEDGYWEGNIYFPKVSVGLYANTTIYVVEKVDDSLVFPTGPGKITFKWDPLNKFVDEFFMFNFDEDYVTQSTTLNYVPNDGPECETLLVNTFDTYEVSLDNTGQTLLPIHIAFCANEKYDATTYNRTLFMYYGKNVVAKIKFYAETVEEDERLNIWNANLGYKITPEDEMIFHRSDINEYKSDYILLNEKRKELMLEGSNIYPYVGSYKAIINAIKFFGYENLNIIEYWKNINPDDVNFGKIYHSSKYSLSNKETLRIGSRNIVLPNKDYKKINSIALVYPINTLTGEYDEWELPKVREAFAYTLEEVLIKLFALKKKLDKEFMPGSSKIIDIIGEGNYFGLHKISTFGVSCNSIDNTHTPKEFPIAIDVAPDSYSYITDNTFFADYLYSILRASTNQAFKDQLLSDLYNTNLSEIEDESLDSELLEFLIAQIATENYKVCQYYKDFKESFVDNKSNNNDDYPYENEEYDYTKDAYSRFSAKFVLINKTYERILMENNECDYDKNNQPSKITWKVSMSKDENQYDDDLRKIGIVKKYEYHDLYSSSTYNLDMSVSTDRLKFTDIKNRFCVEHKDISEYNQFFVQLPFIGYYDVTISLEDANNNVIQEKTFTKFLKVEPYNIDLIGFYYDAREIPDKLKYEMDDGMYEFIQDNISSMHAWATGERASLNIIGDESMPYHSVDGEIINPGPYYTENIENEWYLADNISYELTELRPFVKYTRYIKNGVDVKPYTWFLLGYEYTKIPGKINPVWSIKNNTIDEEPRTFEGKRYLTLLLKKEGEYTVTLNLEDKLGNKYTVSRNIIVVSKSANYKLYQTFKKDYDFITEQEILNELGYLDTVKSSASRIPIIDDDSDEVNVYIWGNITLVPEEVDVTVDGEITFVSDEVDVDIEGLVILHPEEIDVEITGIVDITPDVIDIDIEGEITFVPEEVDVTIDGDITYVPDSITTTYSVSIQNGDDIDNYYISWYKDEQHTQEITEGISDGQYNSTLTTTEENVYVGISGSYLIDIPYLYKTSPVNPHLTPANPNVTINIIQYQYQVIIDNEENVGALASWRTLDDDIIYESTVDTPCRTGESPVIVDIYANGYEQRSEILNNNNPTIHVTLIKNEPTIEEVAVTVEGEITLVPEEVAVTVEGEITLVHEEVAVTVEGEITLVPEEVAVTVDGEITYEDENVEISAEPLVIKETYNYPDLQSESGGFPIIVKNSANKQIDYTVNISNQQNTYNYNFSKITDKQIDIYDNNDDYQYSIILCNKDGYTAGGLSEAHGTFTISSSNANNNVTFDVYGRTGVQHVSRVRTVSNYSFACVQLIPYKNESINSSFTLCGLADGAASISGNRVYYYDRYHDNPVVQRTYTCHKNYANGNNYTFDTNTMIPNDISLTIGRLESTLSYSIAKNTTNRLKFGVVRLSSVYDGDDNLTSYLDTYEREFMCSILQESSNLRFALMSPNNTLSDIDSNYSYYYDKRNPTLLSTIDLSKPSGTEYTLTGKSYLVFLSTDIQNQITVKTANDEIITGQEYQKGNNRILYYNSSSQTFKITIN